MHDQMKKLAYKLLVDALSLEILVFLFVFAMEAVAPGYVSGYLSFTKIIFLLVATLLLVSYFGSRIGVCYDLKPVGFLSKNKITFFLVIAGIILIVNSMFGLNWLEIILTAATAVFIAYYFFQTLLFPE